MQSYSAILLSVSAGRKLLKSSSTPGKSFLSSFYQSICQGCCLGYQRNLNGDSLPPPYDIIIGHFEKQQYSDQVTGLTRLSREICVDCVHYHPSLQYIRAKFPEFQLAELSIPRELFMKLNATHKLFLNSTFGTCI